MGYDVACYVMTGTWSAEMAKWEKTLLISLADQGSRI
jgi:hypothetical protein